MNSQSQLEVLALRLAISKLEEAISVLEGAPVKRKPGRPISTPSTSPAVPKKRTMSPEGRARIAAAQKARWAALAKGKGKKKGAAAVEGGGD